MIWVGWKVCPKLCNRLTYADFPPFEEVTQKDRFCLSHLVLPYLISRVYYIYSITISKTLVFLLSKYIWGQRGGEGGLGQIIALLTFRKFPLFLLFLVKI